MKKSLSLILLTVVIGALSCTKIETLNMRPHTFSEIPRQIIWLQIAGFNEEQLALLRFDKEDSLRPSPFEEIMCLGKMWNYDLFELRPTAAKGFLSQVMGSKNIRGTCQDYDRRPVWSYLSEAGFKVGILESGVEEKDSYTKAFECGGVEGDDFHLNTTIWSMSPPKPNNSSTFHYQMGIQNSYGVYYDKSCSQKGGCYSNLLANVKSIYESYKKDQSHFSLIIRDESFHKALTQKNLPKAKEILFELERVFAYFQNERVQDQKIFLLVTSSSSLLLELPEQGREWEKFGKDGKNLLFKRPSLLSTSLAIGPGAEKFCGIYEESEVLFRLFSFPGANRIRIGF